MTPTLWRLCWYWAPGLPRPTNSCIAFYSEMREATRGSPPASITVGDRRGLLLAAFLGWGLLGLIATLGVGRTQAGWGNDGGDGEVAIRDLRRHALGQGDGRDVERVADVGAGEIDDDLLGDGIGRGADLDRVADDVEGATALQARALLLVDEGHVDLDVERGVGTDAQEVDVQGVVLDRVELVVARNDAVLLAIDVEGDDVGEEATVVDALHRVLVGDGDGQGGLLLTIDDGGDEPLTTQCTSG